MVWFEMKRNDKTDADIGRFYGGDHLQVSVFFLLFHGSASVPQQQNRFSFVY